MFLLYFFPSCQSGSFVRGMHLGFLCFMLRFYRMTDPRVLGNKRPPALFFESDRGPGKTCQNRSVSSPAPVTIVDPSGDMAKYKTRYVCPVRVTTLLRLGYRHTTIWFREYPCVLTISLQFCDHARLQTWLPVSTQLSAEPLRVFQKRMHRSAVPPPLANNPC